MVNPTLILQLPGKTSKTSTSAAFHLDFMQLFQEVKTRLSLSPRMRWGSNTQQTLFLLTPGEIRAAHSAVAEQPKSQYPQLKMGNHEQDAPFDWLP